MTEDSDKSTEECFNKLITDEYFNKLIAVYGKWYLSNKNHIKNFADMLIERISVVVSKNMKKGE